MEYLPLCLPNISGERSLFSYGINGYVCNVHYTNEEGYLVTLRRVGELRRACLKWKIGFMLQNLNKALNHVVSIANDPPEKFFHYNGSLSFSSDYNFQSVLTSMYPNKGLIDLSYHELEYQKELLDLVA